ncbi:hypothetical protein V1477_018256 [Vespula maculifrons]|uniref:Uncharacterized protein n=1 Tax=Vespula maculifrons TaxID=7453 RepID=A0ABD2AYX7_VESMC
MLQGPLARLVATAAAAKPSRAGPAGTFRPGQELIRLKLDITMAFSLLPRRIENEYGDFLDVVVASTVLIVVVVAFAAAAAAVVATSLSMSVQLGTINAC